MLDGVLVLNEVVEFGKRKNRRCMLVKVDFEKAYDCVLWDFLRSMLGSMGFGVKWCGWMKAMVFNSSMFVLVNGSPIMDLKVTRVLRQGDPLSPFLFLLAAEGFSGLMHQAVPLGEFEGFHFNDSNHFEFLQFADATILIGEGSWNNLWTINTFLRGFELVLGLRLNLSKTNLCGLNLDSYFFRRPQLFCLVVSVRFPSCFLNFYWH